MNDIWEVGEVKEAADVRWVMWHPPHWVRHIRLGLGGINPSGMRWWGMEHSVGQARQHRAGSTTLASDNRRQCASITKDFMFCPEINSQWLKISRILFLQQLVCDL